MPEHLSSAGPEIVDYVEPYGFNLDQAQVMAINMISAEAKFDGHWGPACFEFACIACRQNLKTHALSAWALGDVFLFDSTVAWTAHVKRTSTKVFDLVVALIDNHDELRRKVKKIETENGHEEIQTLTGGVLSFLARTANGARGLSHRKLVLDEGLLVTSQMLGSYMPIMLAQTDPQVIWASSPGLTMSTELRKRRDRGRAGAVDPTRGDQGLGYLEYVDAADPTCELEDCTHEPETPGCCADDEDRIRRANAPALAAGRTSMRTLRNLRNGMPADEWVRECLGWWEESVGEAAIHPDTWEALKDAESGVASSPRFALAASPTGTWAAIAVVGRGTHSAYHGEITGRTIEDEDGLTRRVNDYRSGTGWVIPRLRELAGRWPNMRLALLAGSRAETLKPAIEKLGITVDLLTMADYAAACGLVDQVTRQGDLRHPGQLELTLSINATKWRDVGEKTQVWGRRVSTRDITCTDALTFALWLAYEAEEADYDELDSIY